MVRLDKFTPALIVLEKGLTVISGIYESKEEGECDMLEFRQYQKYVETNFTPVLRLVSFFIVCVKEILSQAY